MGQSRTEDILEATINDEPYTEPPRSRVEELLLELKEVIEQGGGGGTIVIANPQGEPSEVLQTIQIGSVIFSIAGSSGNATGVKVVDKLYEASTGAGAPLSTDISYLNSHNLTDYDYITVVLSDSVTYAQGNYTQVNSFAPESLMKTPGTSGPDFQHPLLFTAIGNRSCNVAFYKTNFRVLNNYGDNEGEEPSIFRIYGVKLGTSDVEIEANPEGEATETLEKLRVGDNIYGVEGGGGTTVVANPEGEATDVLEKLKVGGSIYGIESNSNFELTNLWNYVEDNAGVIPYRNFSPLTLKDSIAHYDGIFMEVVSDIQDTSDWKGTVTSPIYMIEALSNALYPYSISFTSYGGRCGRFELTDTTIACVQSEQNMVNGLVNVWGINFGGGHVKSETLVLWSGEQTPTAGNPYRANLSRSFRDYDFLVVECHESRDDTNMPFMIPVSSIIDDEGYGYEYQQSGIYFVPIDNRHIDLYLFASINPTTYTCIRGIKCGIRKDDPFKKDLLWSGIASRADHTGHLGKPITEYPFLMMYYSDSSVAGMYEWHVELVDTTKLTDYENNMFSYEYYGQAYIRGKFVDSSNFLITTAMADAGVYPVLREIYGVDFGSGNGQNGSFQKDLLYAATTISGAPLQTDIPYFTDRNFFDYDLITLIQCNVIDTPNDQILSPCSFTPDELYKVTDGTYLLSITGYKERYMLIRFSEHSFNITAHAAVNESGDYSPSIYKMYGFKFGESPHQKTSRYLPATLKQRIVCEATMDNFDHTSLTWGEGISPIRLTNLVNTQDGGVLIPVKTDGIIASVDMETINRPFTAYIVAKVDNPTQYSRIMSIMGRHTTDNGLLLSGSPVQVSSWANDTLTGVDASNYFVGAIQYLTQGVAFGKVNNVARIWKPPVTIGRTLVIGRTDTEQHGQDEEPSDITVKYFAVVDSAEPVTSVEENVAGLMERFNIS